MTYAEYLTYECIKIEITRRYKFSLTCTKKKLHTWLENRIHLSSRAGALTISDCRS